MRGSRRHLVLGKASCVRYDRVTVACQVCTEFRLRKDADWSNYPGKQAPEVVVHPHVLSLVRNQSRPSDVLPLSTSSVGASAHGAQSRPSTSALSASRSPSPRRIAWAYTRNVNFGSVCPSAP